MLLSKHSLTKLFLIFASDRLIVFLNFLVTLLSLLEGISWLALISLTVQATRSLCPNSSRILHWPLGLCGLLVINYATYWIMWSSQSLFLTKNWVSVSWGIISFIFFTVSLLRPRLSSEQENTSSELFSVFLLLTIPTLIVIWSVIRLSHNPVSLIAGYLGGGDHGAHAQIVHRILGWGPLPYGASPMSIDTYPNGLHFLIANLVALDSENIGVSNLGRVYSWASWFEWIQLAAFCQACLLVITGSVKKMNVFRSVYACGALIFLLLINNAFFHLFWSGFTTSLASTWILLVIPVLLSKNLDSNFSGTHPKISWLLIIVYAQWITYPPFIIPTIVLAIALFLKENTQKLANKKFNIKGLPWWTFISAVVVTLTPYFVLGSSHSFISTLINDGATTQPFYFTTVLSVVVALFAASFVACMNSTTIGQKKTLERWSLFIVSLAGFAISLTFIVILISNLGFLNQPYYIQKIYWILVFISLPIFFSAFLTLIEYWMASTSLLPLHRFVVILLIPIFPFTQGRSLESATRHLKVDWFSKSIVNLSEFNAKRAIAFAASDGLGSHVSNLALSMVSEVQMPVELSIEGDVERVCEFVSTNDVNTIFTISGGRGVLIDAGCSSEIEYVEEGKLAFITR